MFQKLVSSNAFTKPDANLWLDNIISVTGYEDVSFHSTIRALLGKRGEGKRLELYLNQRYSRVIDYSGHRKSLIILQRGSVDEYHEAVVTLDSLEEFEEQKKINTFFAKSFEVHCYINRERELSIVVIHPDGIKDPKSVHKQGVREHHYLQCAIPVLLPWFFEGDNKELNEKEIRLLNSLRGTSLTEYLDALQDIAKDYNFKELKTRRVLADFESYAEKQKVDSVTYEVDRLRGEIERWNECITATLQALQEKSILLTAYKNAVESAKNGELMDYFLRNKNVEVIDCDMDGRIKFIAKGVCDNFDSSILSHMIENPKSYLYSTHYDSIISNDDVATLLEEIFVKQNLKIHFCAAYTFDRHGVRGCRMSTSDFIYDDSCIPNPHIQEYNCLGGYISPINEALQRQDYITAIELCTASCKSLNFADSTVITKFIQNIHESVPHEDSMRGIELPNGEIVTPIEAIQYIYTSRDVALYEEDEEV